jgi:hypothetical protein
MERKGGFPSMRGRSAVPVAAAAQIFFEERKACAKQKRVVEATMSSSK